MDEFKTHAIAVLIQYVFIYIAIYQDNSFLIGWTMACCLYEVGKLLKLLMINTSDIILNNVN